MELTTGQFNDFFIPIMDGAGVVAQNYAYWLNKKYGKAYAIAPKVKGYEDQEEYEVLRYKSIPFPGMSPFRIGVPQFDHKFKKNVLDIPFDLVHAHCPFVSGRIALEIARRRGIPIVATFHSKYREDFTEVLRSKSIVDRAMKKVIEYYDSVDHVWVPSKATAETLREYGFKGSTLISLNGTDMPIPTKEEKKRYRKQGEILCGTSHEDFVFLFVGQHRWVKNVKLIIQAIKILHGQEKNFRMIFVGEGCAARNMQKMVRESGLKDKVKFMGVVIDRESLKAIYARADLFLFPSLYDNAGLVMREAAAFQIPTVVTRGSSVSEGIIDGKNGFVAENDPVLFANKLRRLMGQPGLIKTAGDGALHSIYLHWENIVDEVYKNYIDIVNTHKKNDHELPKRCGSDLLPHLTEGQRVAG